MSFQIEFAYILCISLFRQKEEKKKLFTLSVDLLLDLPIPYPKNFWLNLKLYKLQFDMMNNIVRLFYEAYQNIDGIDNLHLHSRCRKGFFGYSTKHFITQFMV
jgi:hypothetical protein